MTETGEDTEASELVAGSVSVVYQGEDLLGGSGWLSDMLAQEKLVLPDLRAGLCRSCRAEMSVLQQVADGYAGSQVVLGPDIGRFLGLGTEEEPRDLNSALEITFPGGRTPDPTVLQNYRFLGLPPQSSSGPPVRLLQGGLGL